jgi:hypothetical protein
MSNRILTALLSLSTAVALATAATAQRWKNIQDGVKEITDQRSTVEADRHRDSASLVKTLHEACKKILDNVNGWGDKLRADESRNVLRSVGSLVDHTKNLKEAVEGWHNEISRGGDTSNHRKKTTECLLRVSTAGEKLAEHCKRRRSDLKSEMERREPTFRSLEKEAKRLSAEEEKEEGKVLELDRIKDEAYKKSEEAEGAWRRAGDDEDRAFKAWQDVRDPSSEESEKLAKEWWQRHEAIKDFDLKWANALMVAHGAHCDLNAAKAAYKKAWHKFEGWYQDNNWLEVMRLYRTAQYAQIEFEDFLK